MQYRIHQPVVIERRRHPKRWLIGAGLLVSAVAVVIKIIAAPTQGHTTSVDQTYKKTTYPIANVVPASTIDNQYFRLPLPAGYKLNASQLGTADALLSDTIFKSSNDGTRIIAVAIVSTPSGGLEQLSNYRARATAPAVYRLTQQTIKGQPVTLSERLDGEAGEVVAFWPHGSDIATLAISTGLQSGGDTAVNRANLQTLLDSWQWK
jgi:hypothetical protein